MECIRARHSASVETSYTALIHCCKTERPLEELDMADRKGEALYAAIVLIAIAAWVFFFYFWR